MGSKLEDDVYIALWKCRDSIKTYKQLAEEPLVLIEIEDGVSSQPPQPPPRHKRTQTRKGVAAIEIVINILLSIKLPVSSTQYQLKLTGYGRVMATRI